MHHPVRGTGRRNASAARAAEPVHAHVAAATPNGAAWNKRTGIGGLRLFVRATPDGAVYRTVLRRAEHLPLAVPHNFDRAAGAGRDSGRHAAQQQPLEAAVPLGAHHTAVGAEAVGLLE